MHTLRRSAMAVAIALGGAVLSLPATAGDVAWSVSVGGPGFVLNAGQPVYGPAWRPAYRPVARPFVRPVVIRTAGFRPFAYRPVVVAPPVWIAPRVVVAPRPVYFAPRPVYFAPRPVFAPRVVVAPRPYVAFNAFPDRGWAY